MNFRVVNVAEVFRNELPIFDSHRSLIQALLGDKYDNNFEPRHSRDAVQNIEWTWEEVINDDFVYLMNDNRDVKFHRNFSSGTAVVRGTQPMSNNQYFWEVRMISPVYGTDMMVGVGTSEADLAQVHERFVSLLGLDSQTWGLSYTGLFHHNGESREYATRFGQGSTIGIHLDMWNGTLSFYKNKKYLGIASRGLKGKTLYAMASSTAACSGMRIVRSCSFPSSLQFLCCARLRELIPDDKDVLKEIKFPPGMQHFLQVNLSWLLNCRYGELGGHNVPLPRDICPYAIEAENELFLQNFDFEDSDIDTSNLVDSDEEDLTVRMRSRGRRGQDLNLPICNCDEFRLSIPTSQQESENMPRNVVYKKKLSEEPQNSVEGQTGPVQGPSKSIEQIEPVDDLDSLDENGAKRRRCSYNYAIGLSDPDSD